MKITYCGSGYVGQVNAATSAKFGHKVILVDIIKSKVDNINKGHPTIFEKGLNSLMKNIVLEEKTLQASMDLKNAIDNTEITFICVGTPDNEGQIDLKHIREVANAIGDIIKNIKKFHIVVVKSTVIPGTTLNTVLPILEKKSGKKAGVDFGIAMNPEFLREGVALDDCINPDSVVIGILNEDTRTKKTLRELYHWVEDNRIIFTGISEAEAIKYAKNSFLAMKITFANEWANYCEIKGMDAKEILDAIGKDKRISPMFLRNGPGYGGSCFPKDVNAIVYDGKISESPFQILTEVVKTNKLQYHKLIELALKNIPGKTLEDKTIAVLGLSFKPFTDDVRESPALKLIQDINENYDKCKFKVFCPQGLERSKLWFEKQNISNIIYSSSAEECIQDANYIFIPTDWPEFKEIFPKTTLPIFIGHRSYIGNEEKEYSNIFTLGMGK